MMDRRTDFCSNNSSDMYYQCETGKCSAESQVNGEIELITDSSCKYILNYNTFYKLKTFTDFF